VKLGEVASLETDGIWYLASPYTKYVRGLDAACNDVAAVAAALLGSGIHVFSPITHSHPIADAGALEATDLEFWEKLDRHFCEMAHGCIVALLPGWENSAGVAREVRYFVEANKPVIYLELAPEQAPAKPALEQAPAKPALEAKDLAFLKRPKPAELDNKPELE